MSDSHTQTSKELAALRQSNAAIEHARKMELECAITLAAAAENLIPATEEPHLFRFLRDHPPTKGIDLNTTANWLKHPTEYDKTEIFEFEAATAIFRAVTKYWAVYKVGPREWLTFLTEHWPTLEPLLKGGNGRAGGNEIPLVSGSDATRRCQVSALAEGALAHGD